MPRRARTHTPLTRPLPASHSRAEMKADGRWIVRTMPGADAAKTYRCPACEAEIRPGTAHVVAWLDEGAGSEPAVAARRHWHTACWERRP